MKRILVLVDSLNFPLEKSKRDQCESITVFCKSGCIDIESIKFLASSVEEIYVSSAIMGDVSAILEGKISIFESKESTQASRVLESERPVAFFVANDTIAKMLINVVRFLKQPALFILPHTRSEGATDIIDSENMLFRVNKPGLLALHYPSVLVMGNDWGGEEKQLIASATRLNIPSVCIQEGCLDWQGELRRMQWSTFAFIQGPATTKYLSRAIYFLTGNPRFDSLFPIPLPPKTIVMINSNFTYGIFEDQRDQWLDDVANACRHVGFDFFISQHPREVNEIEKYTVKKSNANVVHSQISECSILISRFSTVIYEAVLMGRQVIYYNPHGETMQLFNEDSTSGIYKAYSPNELSMILENLKNQKEQKVYEGDNFIISHCGKNEGMASQRCANSIQEIKKWSDSLSKKPFILRLFYYLEEQGTNIFMVTRHKMRNFLKFVLLLVSSHN